MNLAAYARIENAAYRAGHKIIQDKPKPAIPKPDDDAKVIAAMRTHRLYTAGDIAARSGLDTRIAGYALERMSRLGLVKEAGTAHGIAIYALPGPRRPPREHKPVHWTPEQKLALVDDAKTMTAAQIAGKYGKSRSATYSVLRQIGVMALPDPNKTTAIEIDIPRAKALRNEGLSYAAIGKALGVDGTTVRKKLRAAGFTG